MIKTDDTADVFIVEAADPLLIGEEISLAVDAAIQVAMKEGQYGVLVSRLDHGKFAISVSPRVPYGQTLEEIAAPATT